MYLHGDKIMRFSNHFLEDKQFFKYTVYFYLFVNSAYKTIMVNICDDKWPISIKYVYFIISSSMLKQET